MQKAIKYNYSMSYTLNRIKSNRKRKRRLRINHDIREWRSAMFIWSLCENRNRIISNQINKKLEAMIQKSKLISDN